MRQSDVEAEIERMIANRQNNVHVLIATHDNGCEVIAVYRDYTEAAHDLEMYERGSEEAGNVVYYMIETHTLR